MTERYSFDPTYNAPTVNDALCFKCHSAANLFSDVSFEHDLHVNGQGFACTNCHDPHGSAQFPHLINFLTTSTFGGQTLTITGAAGFPEPTWQDNGQFSGTCFLDCHGEVHDGFNY